MSDSMLHTCTPPQLVRLLVAAVMNDLRLKAPYCQIRLGSLFGTVFNLFGVMTSQNR